MTSPDLFRPMVSLVGAGPGDPELITVKGLARLQVADVVLYDALIIPQTLAYAPPAAQLIPVGKRCGQTNVSQEQINALMIEHAQAGRHVVRLKGGDPFLFGRGGEEAEALRAAGIPFEMIPGVSSALAVPAYAGIPLTHREYAASVAIVTGHRKAGNDANDLDWQALAQVDTLVILMGSGNLPKIVHNLRQAGRPAGTPVALMRWGTTCGQEIVTGTLADIEQRAGGLTPPVVIVIGEVVSLRERISWFEQVII